MITAAYSDFFRELQENNNKAWFHANKNRYENDVKAPFVSLLEQLLPELISWDSRILADPKKALFRINRDVRFSKDQAPYNLIMKAGCSPEGKKSIYPGYYLGIDAHSIYVGGGLFMIAPAELKKVRDKIADEIDTFLAIVGENGFRQQLGGLKGEVSKRLDKSLQTAANKTPLIYNKQFYAMAELPLADYYASKGLSGDVLKHFASIRPLNEFLNGALIS